MEHLAPIDRTTILCKAWLAIEAERRALTGRWAMLEDHMVNHHQWFNLTDAQQLAMPQAAEMHALDARLTALQKDCEEILPQLPGLAAKDRPSLLFKFQVVETLLLPEESPEAKALLKSSLCDLVGRFI